MNNNKIEKSRELLFDFIKSTGKSQAMVSKELGISPGTLSQFLSCTYIGLNEEIAKRIYQYLKMENERRNYTSNPAFTDKLTNTQLITTALSYIHTRGGICTIVGAAGSGKTTALQHYADKNNGVIYIQVDATKTSPRAVLKLINKSVGENTKGSASDMLDNLIDSFIGTKKLIIIDEAQHLTERSFDTVRALSDKAGIGIVYAGTPDIRNRMVGRKKEELDQVYSRIAYDCEIKNSYKLSEIKDLFSGYKLDDTVIKSLYNISKRKGGLRLAINLFKLANDMADRQNEVINTTYLQIAAKHVGTGELI